LSIKQENGILKYDANTQWVHVFKAMFESGDVARMSPEAFTVYCCIKSFVSWQEGISAPPVEIIAEKTGLSERHILRCLKVLEEMQYLTKRKEGRRNIYTLREKVQFIDKDGRPAAVATFDYLPALVKKARAELNNFKLTGDEKVSIINIEKLVFEHVNIVQGDQILVGLDQVKDKGLREQLLKIKSYTHD
jgi:DNA-binding transcriptional ArsR family regulator